LRQIASDPSLEGFSGADLAMLVREASLSALLKVRDSDKLPEITMDDFSEAMKKTFPSVSKNDEQIYMKL
jgi:SpoVK/Ycf46/Vps4 family AAA+-type ATPase